MEGSFTAVSSGKLAVGISHETMKSNRRQEDMLCHLLLEAELILLQGIDEARDLRRRVAFGKQWGS